MSNEIKLAADSRAESPWMPLPLWVCTSRYVASTASSWARPRWALSVPCHVWARSRRRISPPSGTNVRR